MISELLSQLILSTRSGMFFFDCNSLMTTLIQLRFSVDRLVGKKLFQYNATPLVQLLIKCEELYENS